MKKSIFGSLTGAVLLLSSLPAFGDGFDLVGALRDASPGETVEVPAGIYRGDFRLPEGVILKGEGAEVTVLKGTGKEPVLRGPYFVFTRKEGKKTVGYRLRTAAEKEAVRRDVAAHKRFVALCRQFEELTEKLGELERESSLMREEKKLHSSPSRKTRK